MRPAHCAAAPLDNAVETSCWRAAARPACTSTFPFSHFAAASTPHRRDQVGWHQGHDQRDCHPEAGRRRMEPRCAGRHKAAQAGGCVQHRIRLCAVPDTRLLTQRQMPSQQKTPADAPHLYPIPMHSQRSTSRRWRPPAAPPRRRAPSPRPSPHASRPRSVTLTRSRPT